MSDPAVDGDGWDLISINEFDVVCQDPSDRSVTVTRYNEQYTLFGNRGIFFGTESKNTFEITEIECDLTDAYYDTTPSTNVCAVSTSRSVADVNGLLYYKDTQGRITEDWYAEIVQGA